MNCSSAGFPVLHYFQEFVQTYIHWVNDPVLPLSPLSLKLFQHQAFFQWAVSLHQVAKVLEFQLQYQPFQWIFKVYLPQDGLVWFPCSPRDSQEPSPTQQSKAPILWCSAFFTVQLSHPYMTTRKTTALTRWTLLAKWCLCFLICCLGWS